jgi:hypothetical protein
MNYLQVMPTDQHVTDLDAILILSISILLLAVIFVFHKITSGTSWKSNNHKA